MQRKTISTGNAPAAIGTYSQAVRVGDLVFLSGQIPLVPESMEVVSDDIDDQIDQVFRNIAAVCEASGASLQQVAKFTVYLTDLSHFPRVNAAMEKILDQPYPARAVVEVSALPRGVLIEVEAVVALTG